MSALRWLAVGGYLAAAAFQSLVWPRPLLPAGPPDERPGDPAAYVSQVDGGLWTVAQLADLVVAGLAVLAFAVLLGRRRWWLPAALGAAELIENLALIALLAGWPVAAVATVGSVVKFAAYAANLLAVGLVLFRWVRGKRHSAGDGVPGLERQ